MMEKMKNKIFLLLLVFLGVEMLSVLAFAFSPFNKAIFVVLALLFVVLSVCKLEWGLLIVLAELFIGSKGYLFYFPVEEVQISIRLTFWVLLMIIFAIKFLIQVFKYRDQSKYFRNIRHFIFTKTYFILFTFVALALVTAFYWNNSLSNIFLDFNAWLYFLLLIPIVAIYHQKDKKMIDNLKLVFLSAVIWLSVKTLLLLFIFTHSLSFEASSYLWLRKSLIGEMTPTITGWPRVFIQSQIFPVIAYFFFLFRIQKYNLKELFKFKKLYLILLPALFASSLLISFSRSFWLASLLTGILVLILIWKKYSFKKMMTTLLWVAITGIVSFAIIYLTAILPIAKPGEFKANFVDRVSNTGEAAVVSRWSLLNPLFSQIMTAPVLGRGFGATVSYISSDPRVLEANPSGEYTTYAFEWGYLDMWLKFGILGLLAYLSLLFMLIRDSFRLGFKKNSYLFLGIGAGIVFLAITHFFTPYLNHPLGIGFIILSSCLISRDRVY